MPGGGGGWDRGWLGVRKWWLVPRGSRLSRQWLDLVVVFLLELTETHRRASVDKNCQLLRTT